MKTLILMIVVSILLTATAFAEGQIDISYAGYTISQPGSYIVVKDLYASTDQNAITITTSEVSLDLNGHTLYGAGTTAGTNGYGILGIGSNERNISIYNGTVRDFRLDGIRIGGLNLEFKQIRAFGNGSTGIYFLNGNGLASECIVQKNVVDGMLGGNGCVIQNCNANANGGIGIFARNGSSIINNSATFNTLDGISTGALCTVAENGIVSNGRTGIFADIGSSVINNSSGGNSVFGIRANSGSSIIGNTVYQNASTGIFTGSGCNVLDNTARVNTNHGIHVSTNCQVKNNLCINNGNGGIGSGILVSGIWSVIENNSLISNDTGLLITVSSTYFASNKASGNTLDYSTTGGGTQGTGDNINISFYSQSNFMVQQFSGMNMPMDVMENAAVIRNLKY